MRALEKLLEHLDPASDEYRNIRAHIVSDKALGDRKARRLVSPYEATRIHLFRIQEGSKRVRGVGITMRLNDKHNVQLLLDTGASGIAISPKAAERAGLEVLGNEKTEEKGIGDQSAQSSLTYLASEIRFGSVTFADYPISVFRSAKSSDFDGLIGADVFQRFVVHIDFPSAEMELEPRPSTEVADSDDPEDRTEKLQEGFYRIYRFGSHLVVPTQINGKRVALFLIDSGSSSNLVDTETAREVTKVNGDAFTRVEGIQGKVNETSRAQSITLVFAGFRQQNPDLLSINLDKASDGLGVQLGGVIGWPVLGQLKVSIDYRNGSVRMEHRVQ